MFGRKNYEMANANQIKITQSSLEITHPHAVTYTHAWGPDKQVPEAFSAYGPTLATLTHFHTICSCLLANHLSYPSFFRLFVRRKRSIHGCEVSVWVCLADFKWVHSIKSCVITWWIASHVQQTLKTTEANRKEKYREGRIKRLKSKLFSSNW